MRYRTVDQAHGVGSVYALIDPRTEEVRYIGQTLKRLRERLDQHLAKIGPPSFDGSQRAHWLRELAQAGLRPKIKLIQRVPAQHLDQAEAGWIAAYRKQGCPLTNKLAGRTAKVIEQRAIYKGRIK